MDDMDELGDMSEGARKLMELRRQKKKTRELSSMGLGLICMAAAGFAMAGWPVPAVIALICATRLWSDSRRKLLEFDLEIALAELDRLEAQQAVDFRTKQDERVHKEERRKAMLAGIEFDRPGGRFEGEVVFLRAIKDGREYEYAGIASQLDEPSHDMLIVNDLIYKRVAKDDQAAS